MLARADVREKGIRMARGAGSRAARTVAFVAG